MPTTSNSIDADDFELVDAVLRAHSGYHLHQADAVRLLRMLGVSQQDAIQRTDAAGLIDVMGEVERVAVRNEREACAKIAEAEAAKCRSFAATQSVHDVAEAIRNRT